MVEFLWVGLVFLVFGLVLGFAIGTLSPGREKPREEDFMSRVQGRLKNGDVFTLTMTQFGDDDDDDDDDEDFNPLLPDRKTAFRYN